MPTPAEVVRQIFVDAELVLIPDGQPPVPNSQAPLCYIIAMPDDGDYAVEVRNTPGHLFGRSQRSQTLIHPGVQVKVRAPSSEGPAAFELAQTLANYLDTIPPEGEFGLTVTVDGVELVVESVYRKGGILDMGEETGKRRQLCSFNLCVAFQSDQPTAG